MLSTFVSSIDVDSIRVYSPKPAIFVCGGKRAERKDDPPLSLRDVILRNNVLVAATGARLFVVESLQRKFLLANVYDDFFVFENDMAQVCDLVFLVSESPGSFTELGSFARDNEVARKLFAVVRDTFYHEDSYINVGPIRHLEKYHEGSVFVISDKDYNIDPADLSKVDHAKLAIRLLEPIRAKLKAGREHSSFARDRNGHLCKLLTAFIQEFGALTLQELAEALEVLGVPDPERNVLRLMFCAQSVEWIREDRRGLRTFYVPCAGNRAAKLTFTGDSIPNSVERRRSVIRKFWDESDEERADLIRESIGAEAEGEQ